MRMIGSHEAKQKFSELVRRAERGETIGITRYGKLVALIRPIEAAQFLANEDSGRAETEPFKKRRCGRSKGTDTDQTAR